MPFAIHFRQPIHYTRVVLWLTAAVVGVLAVRDLVLDNHLFHFLLWNLFLGFLPLAIAYGLHRYYARLPRWALWLGGVVWLLFYPNAPYMISDLMHNQMDPDAILYDTLILFGFAMLSLFYGFLSLKLMFRVFVQMRGRHVANTALVLSLLLSSLGFYMGRVIRFNSWDIFTKPLAVLRGTLADLFPVSAHLDAYAVMLLFGGLQYLLLVMMRDVGSVRT